LFCSCSLASQDREVLFSFFFFIYFSYLTFHTTRLPSLLSLEAFACSSLACASSNPTIHFLLTICQVPCPFISTIISQCGRKFVLRPFPKAPLDEVTFKGSLFLMSTLPFFPQFHAQLTIAMYTDTPNNNVSQ
jgi:hypothetical protein